MKIKFVRLLFVENLLVKEMVLKPQKAFRRSSALNAPVLYIWVHILQSAA